MAACTVYLVRHGETDYNATLTLQGQLDIPLNTRGEAQAAAAGAWLAPRLPAGAHVVSSDLSRAWSTAAAISAAAGAGVRPAVRDVRLRETHLGGWQGRSWAAIEADAGPQGKAAAALWRSDPDVPAPGGGEAVRARFARVAAALHEAALVAGRSPSAAAAVVVVAHGGVIDDVARLVLGTPYAQSTRLKKVNCCVCELAFAPHAEVAAAMAAAGDDAAAAAAAASALVAASPALAAGSIEPELAKSALGAWSLRHWGVTEHLNGKGDAPLADPLADDPHFAGRVHNEVVVAQQS